MSCQRPTTTFLPLMLVFADPVGPINLGRSVVDNNDIWKHGIRNDYGLGSHPAGKMTSASLKYVCVVFLNPVRTHGVHLHRVFHMFYLYHRRFHVYDIHHLKSIDQVPFVVELSRLKISALAPSCLRSDGGSYPSMPVKARCRASSRRRQVQWPGSLPPLSSPSKYRPTASLSLAPRHHLKPFEQYIRMGEGS